MSDTSSKPHQGFFRGANAGYTAYVYLALFVVGSIVFFPLLAAALGGFKSLGELRTNPFGIPYQWEWQNYWTILTGPDYWRLLGNSLAIAGITVFLTLVLGSMAAFTFVHLKFFGREMLFSYFLLGLMFPGATAIVPLFLRIRDLGLLDSYFGVALPQVAFGLSMSVLLFRKFFKDIPAELYEAAMIDGASYFRCFISITVPLSRPIISTVAIIAFVGSWNNYLLPLIMLNESSRFPWPLGVMNYMTDYSADWQMILAFVTLTNLPTIVVFALAQKYIVAGLTAGAVKG